MTRLKLSGQESPDVDARGWYRRNEALAIQLVVTVLAVLAVGLTTWRQVGVMQDQIESLQAEIHDLRSTFTQYLMTRAMDRHAVGAGGGSQ